MIENQPKPEENRRTEINFNAEIDKLYKQNSGLISQPRLDDFFNAHSNVFKSEIEKLRKTKPVNYSNQAKDESYININELEVVASADCNHT